MDFIAIKPFVPSGAYYEESITFFQELGFTLLWSSDELCELGFEGGSFLFQRFEHVEMQQNYMLMVQVRDLDAFHEQLQTIDLSRYPGVRFNEPRDMPWGQRELHLIDMAGVCWHFV